MRLRTENLQQYLKVAQPSMYETLDSIPRTIKNITIKFSILNSYLITTHVFLDLCCPHSFVYSVALSYQSVRLYTPLTRKMVFAII